MKIPWFILGDGEKDTIKSLRKSLEQLYNHKNEIEKESNIFVLDKECDFEKYLIEKGYVDEIKQLLLSCISLHI